MSVGAICFTSSGSNGGCWVVLVFPRFFLWKNGFFFPIRDLCQKKKSIRDLHPKKKFPSKKKTRLTPKKKSYATYAKKKKRLTLISTIELRFPPTGPPISGDPISHSQAHIPLKSPPPPPALDPFPEATSP